MKLIAAVTTCTLLFGAAAAPSLAQNSGQPAAASYKTVSSEAFSKASGGAMLIDVREPAEWTATGMPANASGIPISSSDFITRVLAANGGDKSKPVAVICKSGARSQRAAEQLTAAGFTNVTNVGDGMMGREGVGKGWLVSGLAVSPYKAE